MTQDALIELLREGVRLTREDEPLRWSDDLQSWAGRVEASLTVDTPKPAKAIADAPPLAVGDRVEAQPPHLPDTGLILAIEKPWAWVLMSPNGCAHRTYGLADLRRVEPVPDTLTLPAREISIEEARQIVRFIKQPDPTTGPWARALNDTIDSARYALAVFDAAGGTGETP